MKRVTLLLLSFLFLSTIQAQEEGKTGWNFGALPAVTYNTDLGFQYGALVNLFDYGDGSTFPNYKHNITWKCRVSPKEVEFIVWLTTQNI